MSFCWFCHEMAHTTTVAVHQGLAFEHVAARTYALIKYYKLNMYPYGVIVNYRCPRLAVSIDRKMYRPYMFPEYGLLEIELPQVGSVNICQKT